MPRSAKPSKRSADAQEDAWVADEDRFVLQQAKKKAVIRVKGGRAQPVDWLATTLVIIDPERNPLDDEAQTDDIDLVDPEIVFEGLDDARLAELEKGIDTYLALESSQSNHDYWNMMKTICRDRRSNFQSANISVRGVGSVAPELDKLLAPKTLEELEKLEKQIQGKLASNEPIDTDYWEHLLKSLLLYKARAKLRRVSQSILDSRLGGLRKQQATEAELLRLRLEARLGENATSPGGEVQSKEQKGKGGESHSLDPEPLLRLRSEDKSLASMTADEFAQKFTNERNRALKSVTSRKRAGELDIPEPKAKRTKKTGADSTQTAFDREVARGVGENEEPFNMVEEVATQTQPKWAGQYRPRKPRYFNRVSLGYEWNKYNQTHYDHDNPPPKVVQGYRFNIFYPDLVDKTKAPTYRIERENGRKRGQTYAPAGEIDTCVIRFIAGAPYEDIAFRIVDKEWDYSAKRERGFRSSFDKGILQLHFQFKKIYYRK